MSEVATLTLTDFLLQRFAEDEAAARYAMTAAAVTDREWGGWWLGHYQHYSRHDPARVLAECEAKRRIVESLRDCPETAEFEDTGACLESVCAILALPYADHPDYRPEWRP